MYKTLSTLFLLFSIFLFIIAFTLKDEGAGTQAYRLSDEVKEEEPHIENRKNGLTGVSKHGRFLQVSSIIMILLGNLGLVKLTHVGIGGCYENFMRYPTKISGIIYSITLIGGSISLLVLGNLILINDAPKQALIDATEIVLAGIGLGIMLISISLKLQLPILNIWQFETQRSKFAGIFALIVGFGFIAWALNF